MNYLDSIVVKYQSIGPLLIKMESLVANSNTGKSAVMKEYYLFWERRVFMALTHMVVANLQYFESLLSNKSKNSSKLKAAPRANVPLFRVTASLSGTFQTFIDI
jgi:dynein heavy chain